MNPLRFDRVDFGKKIDPLRAQLNYLKKAKRGKLFVYEYLTIEGKKLDQSSRITIITFFDLPFLLAYKGLLLKGNNSSSRNLTDKIVEVSRLVFHLIKF